MKFTWFNLMPWPYLPEDFREKNRSVWVDIDSSLFDPVKAHDYYARMVAMADSTSTRADLIEARAYLASK